MTLKKFVVTADFPDITGDGGITDEAGNPVSSADIYSIARQLDFFASRVAAQESICRLEVGGLYYFRGRHGVQYVIVTRIVDGECGKEVFTKAANKQGQFVNGVTPCADTIEFQFYEPQCLIIPAHRIKEPS